ncbi:TetR/AcrR family transcriptional regulator [Nocardioides albidus]|uniref:TetR/AcrR family transcriptional regulator n=1 Tax=Nocardioides albidus TaxID=1517589 RepID=A0A5C4VMU9_9ACTN|nr:TetR/AcrR family transcriptional regulator [Nocardioides albidus]TNM36509.1 TetR/AcrR family transcriptional regulator [Nocardioides albidus]
MASSRSRRIGRPPVTVNGMTVPERLVEAALELFAAKGFESTSVQDVVDAAGVTKGAMYHYFASKDDLLAEIYARVLRMQLSQLESFVASRAPITERIAAAAADVVVTTIENLPSTTLFFRSLHQLNPEHELQVRAERRRYHDMFREMVIEGQRSGELRSDIDADLVVDYYFGAVHHLPTWWRPERGPAPEVVGEKFSRMLLDALRATD